MKTIKNIILACLFVIFLSRCSKTNDLSIVTQNNAQEAISDTNNTIEVPKTEEIQKEVVTIIPSNPYTEIPKKIDLDFTKMNYNMASSVMFEMMIEPGKCLDKTVKIDGQFETSAYNGNRYFAVINWDLTGCCPTGLNFIPPDSMTYPFNFLENSSNITVTGIMKEAFNGESNQLYFFATSITN